jgi:hypothetical protein
MGLTRGQILNELARRGELPDEFKDEFTSLKSKGDQEFLSTLPPDRAALIQAIGEGRTNAPSASSRNKDAQIIAQQVAAAYPGFNAADAKAQQAMRVDLAKGKAGDQLKSLNTAIGHLGSLSSSLDNMGNVGLPLITRPVNAVKNWVLNASDDPAITRATMDRQAVSDELETTFRGGRGGTLEGTRGWKESLPLNGGPSQQSAAVQEALKLLSSRVSAIGDQYSQAMGHASDGLQLLNPEAQHTLESLSKKYNVPIPGAMGGGPRPPSVGGGSTPGTPPGGPMAPTQGSGPGGATLATTTRNEITPEQQALASKLEQAINSGSISTLADAVALNPDANPKDIQAALDYRAKGGTGHIDVVPTPAKPVADGAVGSMLGGAANAATFGALPKIGALGSAAIGSVTGKGSFGSLYDNALATNNATLDQNEGDHPLASLAGNVGGFALGAGMLGSAPGLAGILGKIPGAIRPIATDALYGGLTGLGSSDSLDEVGGNVATDAGLMAGGGMLGRGAAKGLAAVIAPKVAPIVQKLAAAGITMTPGQILGASGSKVGTIAKNVEDSLMGFRGIGEPIREARSQGLNDYTRAEVNNALKPINQTVPNSLSGTDAIQWAQDASHAAYDPHLDSMNLNFDLPFANDAAAVKKKIASLPQSSKDELSAIYTNHVTPFLPDNGAPLPGKNLQNIKRGLAKASAAYRSKGDPISDISASALDDLQSAYLDMASRQAPAGAEGYRAADAAYRNMMRLNDAAAYSKGKGVVTPAQMLRSASKKGYGVGAADVATNSAPMQAFANEAQSVLPSTVPDSGTAGRYALGSILGLIGGGSQGGEKTQDHLFNAGVGSLAGAALFSPGGARALQRILIQRGPKAIEAADAIRNRAALVGTLSAPALLGYKTGQ